MPVEIVHAPILFPTRDGELLVGGKSISTLADEIGETPFYVYDRTLIQQRMSELRKALPAGIRINYALKANPFPPLVTLLNTLVDGLDVASAGELDIAQAAGARCISFAGPGKRIGELMRAVEGGVVINIESFRELRLLAEIAEKTGKTPTVAVRVNPDFELKTAGMKMGGGPKPFGVDAEQVPTLLAELRMIGLDFVGFHLFAGSQNLKAEAIAHAQRESYALICRLAEFAPVAPRILNLGGGFGIPYFPGEKRLELPLICDALDEIASDAARRYPSAQIHLELGRYLVGEAGLYVVRVLDIKQSRGHTFVIVDGGLHHHLAASGNFGQVIRKNYPIAIATRVLENANGDPVTVVGPLCTPLDILGEKVRIGVPNPGELVVVFQSGAYGASASPQAFLGHPPPREVLV